jgi:hypothetical protein
MSLRNAAWAAALLVVPVGCGVEVDPAGVSTTQAADCPPADAGGDALIDWVPFVRVGGLMFQATDQKSRVEESDLGATVMTVTCTIGETVGNPDYRPRNGDAAYLAVGTELREVAGYRPDFRLAAWEQGAWRVYEVDDIADAETGEDMLDLRDKVQAVHLVEGERGTGILDSVEDPAHVAWIIEAILAAPVVPESDTLYDRLGNEAPMFVRFDMVDGTTVQRAWDVEAGLLSRRIKAPGALQEAFRQ